MTDRLYPAAGRNKELMRNIPLSYRSSVSLSVYPEITPRHTSEQIRDFYESERPVHLIWLVQSGMILLQSLFLALFESVICSCLPTMAEPQPTLVSELFFWATVLLPLLTPLVLLPFAIWRFHAVCVCGEKWSPYCSQLGLS